MSLWQAGAFLARCPGGERVLRHVAQTTWRDTRQWCQEKATEWREQAQVTGQRLLEKARTISGVVTNHCWQWWQIWTGGPQPARLDYRAVRERYVRL